ncbi:MAG: hypothetical protein GXP25_12030 [Planctomycetes bacterium]|nr:hypothetical protein [Planctomycetota bacterium]
MARKRTKQIDEELAKLTDALAANKDAAIKPKDGEMAGLFQTVKMLRNALQPTEMPASLRDRMREAVAQEIASLDPVKQKKSALQAAVDLASTVSTSIRKKAQEAKELVLDVDLSGIIAEAVAMPRPATADVFAYSADAATQEEPTTVVADSDGEIYQIPDEILKQFKVSKKKQKDLGLTTVQTQLPQSIVLNINLGETSDPPKPAVPKIKPKKE